jgi:DNA-binding transcriptional LysR family regulator
MTRTDSFTGLSEFLAVAEHASFRAAAADLRVTPGAVSQAIRSLETRVGLPLFQRTTRSVALTEAGTALLTRLRPAATEIDEALAALASLRQRPIGHLRLSVPRIALALVIEPVLAEFRSNFPDVSIEVDVDDLNVDLAAGRFDAGIRVGSLIERDMIAVKLTRDCRWLVVGAPAYFASRGNIRLPEDLVYHECLGYRFPTARTVQRWQFTSNGREFFVDPRGSLTVNDTATLIALAKRGLGLAYTADILIEPELASGELKAVLKSHLPTTPGLSLYFPARSQQQPKLRAFIDTARKVLRKSAGRANAER